MQRPQEPGGAADPIRQSGSVERDPLPRIDLSLPVERKVIGIFRDDHLGDRCLGRQPAFDQPRWCGRLHDRALASTATIFRPSDDENTQLRRYDVQPFCAVLPDQMKRA
jgi:hypothetical protein